MGNTRSAHANKKGDSESPRSTTRTRRRQPALKHAIILQGLPAAGKSAVQSQLGVADHRKLEVDSRFLTSPPIYTANWRNSIAGQNGPHGQRDGLHFGHGRDGGLGELWTYGGRGSIHAKWSVIAYLTKAIVFVVDSTDRARIAPAEGFTPLPEEFVAAYDSKSIEEQEGIRRTLESQMTARSMLQQLLEQHHKRLPILILATKQDEPNAMSLEEMATLLDLAAIDRHDWRIAGCNALTGEGIDDSVDWLNYVIANPTDFKKLQQRDPYDFSLDYWRDHSAADYVQWQASRLREKQREAAVARGEVLPAPPIFRPNGQQWVATEQQRAEFVVAPVTYVDPDDEADGVLQQQRADPTRNLELARALLATVHTEESEEGEGLAAVESDGPSVPSQSSSATHSRTSSTSSGAREESTSSVASEGGAVVSLHAATTVHDDAGSRTPTSSIDTGDTVTVTVAVAVKETSEVVDVSPVVEGGKKPKPLSPAAASPRYTGFGNAQVVLPKRARIPTQAYREERSKWLKRKKLVPTDDPTRDIHQRRSRYWF